MSSAGGEAGAPGGRKSTLLRQALRAQKWMAASWLATLAAAAVVPVVFTVVLSVIFGLAGCVLVMHRQPFFQRLCGVLVLVAVPLLGYCGGELWNAVRGSAEGISVREAPAHAGAAFFTFTDGRVWTERQLEHVERGTVIRRKNRSDGSRPYEEHVAVAPVVTAAHREGDPVTVWAACAGDFEGSSGAREYFACVDRWRRPVRAGIALRGTTSLSYYDFRELVDEAASKLGLTSHPDAVILSWEPLHDAHPGPVTRLAVGLVAGAHLLAWLGAGIAALRRRS